MSDDADNCPDQSGEAPELFGLFGEDGFIVERLVKSVRSLIEREGTTPEQVFHLAKLLHALNRLPLPTRGIGIELTLGIRYENGEMRCQQLTLDRIAFELGTVSWIIIDPSAGGDTESDIVFHVEVGGFREVAEPGPMTVMDWLDAFDQRIGESDQELQIHDSHDSSGIDWDAETGEAYWDRLESDYT